jgi:pilus assembly protein CpaC
MKTLKLIFCLIFISFILEANSLRYKEIYDKEIHVINGSFKLLEFPKTITSIKVNTKDNIEVDFLENDLKPLRTIKILTKKIGFSNILITFYDGSSAHISVNIIDNYTSIIQIAKKLSPNISIKQTNGKIILEGRVKNKKTKDKIIKLFEKSGVDVQKDFIDLASIQRPNKMIRVKLYAVEINNTKGLDLKNNWFASSKNYTEITNSDGTYYNQGLNSTSNPSYNNANNQRIKEVNDSINSLMSNAVSLSGGLTGAANYLGNSFNVGLTLNYLASQGVANILDETTLLTVENEEAKFHAGGTIYIKTQTTSSEGLPSTEIKDINYGLQLDVEAANIVNNSYINLKITTKSTQIDWANQVDGIPSFSEKSINTKVIAANQSTIVLGGLINSSNAKDINKIPLLGDIPILGYLFKSESFKNGESELVFFITPEIVNPSDNNQQDELKEKTLFAKVIKEKFNKKIKEQRADFKEYKYTTDHTLGDKSFDN